MSVRNLLLGTHHLRREIAAQSLQLGRDIEHARAAGKNLRRNAVARMTSPWALAAAAGAGFVIEKLRRHDAQTRSAAPAALQAHARQSMRALANAGLSTLRSIGWQWLVPVVIEWIGSKMHRQDVETENTTG